jgi:hypothetical protein
MKADKKAEWISVTDKLPLPGVEVETMIKSEPPSGNFWCLIRRRYVDGVWWDDRKEKYPPPTHWHPI